MLFQSSVSRNLGLPADGMLRAGFEVSWGIESQARCGRKGKPSSSSREIAGR